MGATGAEWRVRAPAPRLRPLIDAYVGYRSDQPEGLHRGLPSGRLGLNVSLAEDIEIVRQTDPRQPPARYGCVVSGLHDTPALIARGGREEGIAILLSPLGSRVLLGVPASDIADRSVDGEDVLGRAVTELRERTHDGSSWTVRFSIVDEILTRLLDPDATIRPELVTSWQLLESSGGRTPVGTVAERIGWSRRHLGARFRGEFGVSPKTAARSIRFRRVIDLIRSQPRTDLAGAAAACGYYDQSHLTREFKKMAGCTPTVWMAEEFPYVQDDAVVSLERGGRPATRSPL